MEKFGMVDIKSADEVTQMELAKREESQTAEAAISNLVNSLIQHVDTKWSNAKDAKEVVEIGMLDSLRQRRGEYNPEKLSQIRESEQPEIFMNITDTKCRNGMAWVKDIIFQPGKRMFGIDPTPIPELPEDVTAQIQQGVLNQYIDMAVSMAQQTGQQIQSEQLRQMIVAQSEEIKKRVLIEVVKKAKSLSDKIEDKIDDDFVEGGFYKALDRAVDDIMCLKAGIIKGPVFRNATIKKTIRDPQTGRLSRQIETRIVPQYERRSPFSIFPSPRSIGINDGYLFDVIILKPKHLHDLIGVEGYNEEEIRAVLREFQNGSLKNDWLNLSQEAKDGLGEEDTRKSNTNYPYENIYCLELWDEIPGKLLMDWGMKDESVSDPEDEYSCRVIKIGNHIISAMLNYDQLGRKPFHKTSFQTDNDSFWGRDIPEAIEDCQQVCNACARNILANVGFASLPMVDLNVDRLEPNASRKIWPARVFPTTDEQMSSGSRAVNFYQPQMVTTQLMNVYDTFSQIADEHSGIPAYSHGDANVGGAGNTASGLNMLIAQAARGIKAVIRNIDNDIIAPVVEYHYDYLLDNTEIFGLVGDYNIKAKGTTALIEKEQMASRKLEFLNNTANPIDIELIGMDARRKMLFDVAKNLGINIEENPFPPTAPMMQQQQQPPQENPPANDVAGNRAQGTETREFNPSAKQGRVSTPGDAGTANQSLRAPMAPRPQMGALQ